MPRNPLAKEEFMQGTRQKWLKWLLICVGVVLVADIFANIDPVVYVTAIGTMGTTFILGAANDSRLKIQAAEKKLELEHEETEQ